MPVVVANCSTHLDDIHQIEKGVLYESDHPIVLANPHLFDTDLLDYAIRTPRAAVVETATAAPGEVRRGPGRPRKDAE